MLFSKIQEPNFGDEDPRDTFYKTFEKEGLNVARMISGSKSGYMHMHPENNVLFNANIFTKSHGKIWFGDLDITLSQERLQNICNEIGENLYILRELDGRFGNENRPFKEVKKLAWKIIQVQK